LVEGCRADGEQDRINGPPIIKHSCGG
jgi:hypothetical protein